MQSTSKASRARELLFPHWHIGPRSYSKPRGAHSSQPVRVPALLRARDRSRDCHSGETSTCLKRRGRAVDRSGKLSTSRRLDGHADSPRAGQISFCTSPLAQHRNIARYSARGTSSHLSHRSPDILRAGSREHEGYPAAGSCSPALGRFLGSVSQCFTAESHTVMATGTPQPSS